MHTDVKVLRVKCDKFLFVRYAQLVTLPIHTLVLDMLPITTDVAMILLLCSYNFEVWGNQFAL